MNFVKDGLVVVPWDGSEDAKRSLEFAFNLTGDMARLRVFQVLDPPMRIYGEYLWPPEGPEAVLKEAEQEFREQLDDPFKSVELQLKFGDPKYLIVAYAKEIDASLVVIATHGRSGLRHLMLGSVAERVVRLAHCPVLVLRSIDSKQE